MFINVTGIEFQNLDKIKSYVTKLTWNPKYLTEFINKRLSVKSNKSIKTIDSFFEFNKNAELKDYQYIIFNNTYWFPRDILHFFELAIKNAKDRNSQVPKLEYRDFKSSLKKYAEFKLEQFTSDYNELMTISPSEFRVFLIEIFDHHAQHGLDQMIMSIKNHPSRTKIFGNMEPKDIILLFCQIGLFGIQKDEPVDYSFDYYYTTKGASDVYGRIMSSKIIMIHEALHKELEIN